MSIFCSSLPYTLIGPMKMLLCAVMIVPVPAQPRLISSMAIA